MRCTLTITCLLVLISTGSRGQDSRRNVFGQCILPLGMEEGKIPDDAITASSSYESKSVGPQNARIRQEKNGGAWCPKAQISSAIREYLEIDLTKNHLIAWTETQGRFGNGQGQEYAEAFFLEYWRDEHWHQYKNLMGDRVLRGNSNTYLVEKQKLDLPFVASRVRFVPYSQHPRTVCMRVEIYGCIWEQYLASYTAPKASSPGPAGWNVQDSSYDGLEQDSLLIDGLGQLTDGILGDLSEIQSLPVMVGTNWVGWADRATVELIFRFQELREFENCSLHVARIPELEVEAFSAVRVLFSIDGQNYETEEEKLETPIDASWADADIFSATIALQARIGRLVKIELNLAAKWLLLSEVTFYTGKRRRLPIAVAGGRNRSNDFHYPTDRSRRVEQNQTEGGEKWSNSASSTISGLNETGFYEIREDSSTPDAFPVGTSQTYIGLVSGLLTIIVLSVSCTVFLLKQRGRNKVALLQKHTALLLDDSSVPGIAVDPKDRKLSNTITSGLSLIRKPITIAATTDSLQNQIGAQINFHSDANDLDSRQHSTVYERTYKLFSEETLALNESNVSTCEAESYLGLKCKSSVTPESAESTMPNAVTYASKIMLQFQSVNLNQRIHEGYYAATDILTIKKRELPSTLSPFTPLHIRNKGIHLTRSTEPYHIPRVSRHRLRILDKLGEGNVGLVHLCKAEGITNSEAANVQNHQTVILRSLWRGVVDSIRLDFTEDMHVLATLRNPNVTKMIALVEEEPFGAVFEYGEFGELPSFLESYGVSDNEASISGPGSTLSFISQIASAMKYLESMNIAHCDLAARNCIVAHKLTIKVSDHAVYCNKYDHQYFIDGSNMKIPLRWMSWEAVTMGKYSSQADVWSFAVTVWEIFTNCKEIPYADLTSAQVLENCNRWYRSEVVLENRQNNSDDEKNQPQVPRRPNRCPNSLYRLMNRCWSKRIADRPNFVEIHRYLERLALD